jgi:hypothetical protein
MANRYKYTVVELREGMIGGKMSGERLEKVLNEHAAQGWQLKAITSVEVKGRVGPGGVEGLLVTLNSRSAELTSTARARSSSVASCRTRSRMSLAPRHGRPGWHVCCSGGSRFGEVRDLCTGRVPLSGWP